MNLTLGTNKRGRPVMLTPKERACHVHVLGGSGFGKSTLLDKMLRHDVREGNGLCLIDPHGTLADSLVEWCASRGVKDRPRVHVIEPAKSDWCLGFNPLRLDGLTEPSARVDAMVSACAQVWGGGSMTETPLLKKCLRAVFYVLAVRNLTLAESMELITSTSENRRALTQNLPDYVFDSLWRSFNALKPAAFEETFSSTANRLTEFITSPVVRRIVGQRRNVLDLNRAMDESEIVILNLSQGGVLLPDTARLLGTLISSELFLLAKQRSRGKALARPFYFYIDECYDFLTSDIEKMLDQTRKFGLHLVLSHQRLGQLGERNSPIYNGVMAGAQTKIVFGGLEDEDAEVMAKQILRDQFDLERPKHSLDKPVVVDETPFWLDSESTSHDTSSSYGTSDSASWSSSESSSFSADGDEGGGSAGSSGGGGYSTNESHSTSQNQSRGRAQTLKPVRVVMPSAVHSLEEEIHLAILRLRQLRVGTAIVRPRERTAVYCRVPNAPAPIVWTDLMARYRTDVSIKSPCLSTIEDAEAELAARQAGLRKRDEPSAAESFWNEEA
jgi:uncharacterized membrane protein YgcG